MSDDHQQPKPARSFLAKLATIVAITGLLSFGLCTATAVTGFNGSGSTHPIAGALALIFGWTAAGCFLALIVLALIAIVKRIVNSMR